MISMKITKEKIILVFLVLLFLGLWFYSSKNRDLHDEVKITSINAKEFDEISQKDDVFIVDVHTPEQEHIKGTDAFIPFDQIGEQTAKLPEDKTTPIIVYCRSGSMSQQASQELIDLGYLQVYDLEGGLNAYREASLAVVIEPETKDLGEVIYGDVATTNFTLKNSTPQKLKITKISTSCSCTSAEMEKQELVPYENSNVVVSFDPAVHKDDTDLGSITRTIYINTDNPNFAKVTATITADVVKK